MVFIKTRRLDFSVRERNFDLCVVVFSRWVRLEAGINSPDVSFVCDRFHLVDKIHLRTASVEMPSNCLFQRVLLDRGERSVSEFDEVEIEGRVCPLRRAESDLG